MRRMFRALARLDDHWIGDLLGGFALFALIPIGMFWVVALGGAQ